MTMTRVQLNQAFREAASLEFVDVPYTEDVIDFEFSEGFQQKMKKLVNRQRKGYWKYVSGAKKRVAIAAIICLSAFITACTNPEFREPILQQVEEMGGKVINYLIDGNVKNIILHEYQISVLPDGFEEVLKEGNFKYKETIYKNQKEDCIKFYQYATNKPNFNLMNNWKEQYIMNIRGVEVNIYEYSNAIVGVWIEDGYGMQVIYDGNCDMNILKEIIGGIE